VREQNLMKLLEDPPKANDEVKKLLIDYKKQVLKNEEQWKSLELPESNENS
jgi:hypothetical protein